jgi:hypothetical protein
MTYVSARIRAIATDPTPANIAELPRLALMVGRMESALDQIVGDAMEDAAIVRRHPKVVPISCGISRKFS